MLNAKPMKHVRIQVLTSELPQISLNLAESTFFAPDKRENKEDDALPNIPGESYRATFQLAKSRLNKTCGYYCQKVQALPAQGLLIDEAQLEKINEWLGDIWGELSELQEQRHRLAEQHREIDQLLEALEDFDTMNIDLDLLQSERSFLDIQLGTVPRENISQLRDALGLSGYLLFPFKDANDEVPVAVIGLTESEDDQLKPLLDTAAFHALEIPPEVSKDPKQVKQDLQQKTTELLSKEKALDEQLQNWTEQHHAKLEQAAHVLKVAAPYVSMAEAATHRGDLSLIKGWVPAHHVEQLRELLQSRLQQPFVLDVRDPEPHEHKEVPTLIGENKLARPFATLVGQYGIPRYGEVNPIGLFSLTYMLMFGMMFGDIGHGAMFALGGILLRKKLKSFTPFVVIAGISSIIFGFLYGSIFGYEEVIHHIWIAPLSDPLYMLTVALLWGIGFLLLITSFNIINHLRMGNRTGALFGDNGLSSMALYIGLIGMGYSVYASGSVAIAWVVLTLAALITLFGYRMIESDAPAGERILVATIETFETITGYLSNTLSFLRVAAFSLNHVALALAVFTLADMSSGAGHWVTIVLGNIFIMVLEGAIVAIQVLRLEYYEGFSRFFIGDGRAFKPLTL